MSTTLSNQLVIERREQETPDLTLSCPADAENVAVIRRAVTGVARAVGVDEGLVNDVRTVITEACGNAAVHAYPADAAGAMVVTCTFEHPWLSFRIRDFGTGMQPQVDSEGPSRLRIGISLMSALADRFEIQSSADEGTEVLVGFDVLRGRDTNGHRQGPPAEPSENRVELVAAGPLGAEGIAPALVMLGVRSGFDVERLAELQRIGTALAGAVRDGHPGPIALRSSTPTEPRVQIDFDPGTAGETAELLATLPDGAGELVELDGRPIVRIELSQGA
jgi:serine/threonine-protein kinase RsbW